MRGRAADRDRVSGKPTPLPAGTWRQVETLAGCMREPGSFEPRVNTAAAIDLNQDIKVMAKNAAPVQRWP